MPDVDQVIMHLFTIRDFIRWGASRMNQAGLHFGHGTADAIDEASALVLHGLNLPPDLPEEYLQSALTPAEKLTVLELLERRIRERKPAAYITREAWFMGLPFYVDERVLVPRSPIAELVEQRFAPWLNPEAVERVLDLCTGSGCIGIACAEAFPDALIDLVDVSAEALEVAHENVMRHALEKRCEIIQSDLFTALDGRQYDLIVTNPPYVSVAQWRLLPEEYRHEPRLGLEAGEQGLDVVTDILGQAADFLTHNGVLVMEVGNSAPALNRTFPDAPFVWLDFERGGEGVLLITAEDLRGSRDAFA